MTATAGGRHVLRHRRHAWLVIAVVGALALLASLAGARSADAAPGAHADATNFSFTGVSVDSENLPVVITGRVTYQVGNSTRAIAKVQAYFRADSHSSSGAPASCGLPDSLPADRSSSGAATLDGNGKFRFEISPACSDTFYVRFRATTESGFLVPADTGDSSAYAVHYEPPPPTTTTTTTIEPGEDPPPAGGDQGDDPGGDQGGTDPTAPGTPTTKGPPTTAKHGNKVTGGLRSAPKSPAAAIPALPGISGSRIQKVNPHIADAPPDTYDPTLNYPEQDAMAQGKTSNNLAGSEDDTKRVFNTRLIAGCVGGAMVTGLFAAQIVLLNRRGRELDESLPRVE